MLNGRKSSATDTYMLLHCERGDSTRLVSDLMCNELSSCGMSNVEGAWLETVLVAVGMCGKEKFANPHIFFLGLLRP